MQCILQTYLTIYRLLRRQGQKCSLRTKNLLVLFVEIVGSLLVLLVEIVGSLLVLLVNVVGS